MIGREVLLAYPDFNAPFEINNDASKLHIGAVINHKTLQASPMQLVFGQDAILNIKHVADWEHIQQRKKIRVNHNDKRENMRRNNHQYKVGDKIQVKRKKNSKHEL